ncbi:SDR family NAD(P)-dependent oxidoreductase [Nocardia sp. CA2R105]|uniref:SDR family oxidoreductase n=1 Tax=Nocardia coffeae TaxID=2873381 RepID=UPI001CA6D9C9|nr:SDR family NAD(P)-dependent oxidoreductase [Nocardia coffeae]MBY8856770.1 SDR family NAD(P)-dependent oxidoreductase [Nocardia coffeae]
MQLTGNTILVTGGGNGIGRGLATALHRMGNRVVIAGRRRAPLEAVTGANPGMRYLQLDQGDPEDVRRFTAEVTDRFPGLDVVINNAGISHVEDLATGDTETAQAIVEVNLLGPIRLTSELLPTLMSRPRAAILNVTSGLAFVPNASMPTYCATKAALHSYTQSLRFQLRDTAVQVIEIIPPRVRTELADGLDLDPDTMMPLNSYVAETMSLLQAQPQATEIVVERVKPQWLATRGETYDRFYAAYNTAL